VGTEIAGDGKLGTGKESFIGVGVGIGKRGFKGSKRFKRA
jgi:hypothetical protein